MNIIEDLEIFAGDYSAQVPKVKADDNLTMEQRNALDVFRKRKNVLYFKADKGTSVVLLDEEFYKNKVLENLNNQKYEKLHRNVDYFVIAKLKHLVRKYSMMLTKSERKAITKLDYKTTNIYGVPKIHKSQTIKAALEKVNGSYMHLPNPS